MTRLRAALRTFFGPAKPDPINAVLSLIAACAVALLVATVAYVELAR